MTKPRFRKVSQAIHSSPWYMELSPRARNMYLNLIPFVGTSGAQNASIGKLSKLCGYDKTWLPKIVTSRLIRLALKELDSEVIFWEDEEIVWLKNFTKEQGNGPKFIAGAIKHAEHFVSSKSVEIISYISGEYTLSGAVSSENNTVSNGRAPARIYTCPPAETRGLEEKSSLSLSLSNTDRCSKERDIDFLSSSFSTIFKTDISKVDTNLVEKALVIKSASEWIDVFERASKSDWLLGNIPRGDGKPWQMQMSWLLNADNAKKILAGKYDNKQMEVS